MLPRILGYNDFEGWLGERMSMKINWIGADSILAAPLILDLARLTEYAARQGEKGDLSHLAIFFKSPQGEYISYEFFNQWVEFKRYIYEHIDWLKDLVSNRE